MIITDNEVIIAGSGNYKKDLIGKKISPTLENKLTKRTTQYLEKGETLELTANYDIKRPSVIKPINVYGDIIGCVIVSADTDITDVDKTLAEFSGVFMSRYLEG